jgi:hypothetical protein
MKRTQLSDFSLDVGKECADCRTVQVLGTGSCHACGGSNIRSRYQSRFPYDAIAAFIGVAVVLLYWLVRK